MKNLYRDIETGEILTLEQLKKEYSEKVESGEIDETEIPTVDWYIHNCLTRYNGTLEKVV